MERFEVVFIGWQSHHPYLIWDNVEETWVYTDSGPWGTFTRIHAQTKAAELNEGKGV